LISTWTPALGGKEYSTEPYNGEGSPLDAAVYQALVLKN
jgi:hypothetical protein